MKKIDKIREREEKKRVEFVKRMEYEKHRRGITKQREDYERAKWKKYVRDINEVYEITNPGEKLYYTMGNKTEGIKYNPAMSNWQRRCEEEIADGKRNRFEKPKEIEIESRKENVILLVGNMAVIKEINIEPVENEFYSTIKINGEEIEIKLERVYPDKNKIYESKFGEIDGENILKVSISTGAKIYEAEMM